MAFRTTLGGMAVRDKEHVDPVCGMTVDPAEAAGSWVHEGRTYYFCNPSCLERFKSDPGRYLAADSRPPAAPPHAGDAGAGVE